MKRPCPLGAHLPKIMGLAAVLSLVSLVLAPPWPALDFIRGVLTGLILGGFIVIVARRKQWR